MTTKPTYSIPSSNRDQHIDKWFTDYIEQLNVDHFMIKEGIASKDTKTRYDALIFKQKDAMISQMSATKSMSVQFLIKSLVFDYLTELKKSNKLPLKLALAVSDSKVMIWAEVNDDDESAEDSLLMVEAVVNAKYNSEGFYLSSTILEKSDNFAIPSHYETIIS